MNHRREGASIDGVFTMGNVPFVIVPLTVVTDEPDRNAHFIPFGTTYLGRTRPDGTALPRVMTLEEFRESGAVLTRRIWKRHALVTTSPTAASAIRTWWTPEWEFGGWYVNLQEPLRRTPTGFTTEDHYLDILVAPDLTWRWKDEDELAWAVERGRVTPAKAAAIRAEGERVIGLVERGAFPFDGTLTGWRPDPNWPVPTLGDAWLSLLEDK